MKRLVTLLIELRKAGIVLCPDGDRLLARAPKGIVTPELRERIAAHKAELIAELRADEETMREIGAILAAAYRRYRGVPRIVERTGELALSPDRSVHGGG